MKKILYILCLCLYCATAVHAQDITGKVVGVDDQPLEFANIALLQASDSSFIKGTVSKEDGTFTLTQPGVKALIRVSYLGYTAKTMSLQADMGKIILEEDPKMLSEVTIKGHRKMFEMGKEGVVTNVIGTPLSKVGTAEDVLQNVPGIFKNQDGFQVFGKGAPTIYLNGREMHDLSELERISSGEITSIEVIQAPGPQYGATTRAVVKIRTVRPKGEGLGVGLRSSYWQSQNTDLREQVNLTYSRKGLYAFGSYELSKTEDLQRAQVDQVVAADTLWRQHNQLEIKNRQIQHTITTGFNYDFNDKHSMGMKYILSFSPSLTSDSHTLTSMMANGTAFEDLDTRSYTVSDNNPHHYLNMFYNGNVLGTSIDLNVDYLFGKEGKEQTSDEDGDDISRTILSQSRIKNNMIAAKLILGREIGKGQFRLGVEAINTNRRDDYTIEGTTIVSDSHSKLRETQVAPFVEYEKKTPIGMVNVGVRYEHVDFKYYEDGIYVPDQSRSFNNFFPQVSLGTNIGNTMLNLSYSVKTKRPTYSQLSSNVSYISRFSLQSGNPTLKDERIHDVSALSVWKWMQFMLSYQDDRDAIIYWDEAVPYSSSITLLQYKNLNSIKSLTAMVAIAPTIGIWNPQLSVGFRKQWLRLVRSNGTVSLGRPIAQISFNNSLSLPFDITANIDMSYQSKGHYQNVYTRDTYSMDLSFTKTFFKGALELNVEGSDLFYTRKDNVHMYGNREEISQRNRYDSRELGITLRYNFNASKLKYKGKGAGNSEKSRM